MLKGGDKAISTVVRRTPRGLELTVQLHAVVEEFMRASAGADYQAVELFGRKWQTTDKLLIYDLPEAMKGNFMINTRSSYRMDKPGGELCSVDAATGIRTINMSFLRLVGASQADGITFSLAGVYDVSDVTWIANAINEAGQLIYTQYIRPMVISVHSTVREAGLAV